MTETRVTGLVFVGQLLVLIVAASILLSVSGRATSYGVAVTSAYPDNLRGVSELGNTWGLIVGGAGGTAFVLMAIGLARVTAALYRAGSHLLGPTAFLLFAIGTVIYVIWATFEIGPTVWAAEQPVGASFIGPYEPFFRWEGILFATFMLFSYLAIATVGLALARMSLVPRWAGWASLIFGLVGTAARVIDPSLPGIPTWILAGVPGWIPLWGFLLGVVLVKGR